MVLVLVLLSITISPAARDMQEAEIGGKKVNEMAGIQLV
jgi:hypothetical protein